MFFQTKDFGDFSYFRWAYGVVLFEIVTLGKEYLF